MLDDILSHNIKTARADKLDSTGGPPGRIELVGTGGFNVVGQNIVQHSAPANSRGQSDDWLRRLRRSRRAGLVGGAVAMHLRRWLLFLRLLLSPLLALAMPLRQAVQI